MAVWTAITLGFHAFLRAGELTTNTPNCYSKRRHLLKRDVADLQDWLVIHIKASKTDQYGATCQVPVAATGRPTCPVRAMRKFLRRARHAESLPLFTLKSGQFLTLDHLTRLLRTVLRHCGIPSQQVQGYSSHSLRIGAAFAVTTDTVNVTYINTVIANVHAHTHRGNTFHAICLCLDEQHCC